ncbi:hypothetical protein EXIGLDRAFT_715884 [Exidia glandulosa HHB12029]|uniref:UBC core domain-containing protein n=1 Tax=Exidia glandulosa HHB12029 TaxID=1314781 RepID=A0A165QMX9_EXIGL|nr:hypothetical protein EXIGLDRAFT_715884 [Exidia glandulosa HHB12029]
MTPEDDDGDAAMEDDDDEDAAMLDDDDDEDGGYIDYDSDYETRQETARQGASNADPYAGIFFSKDRKEEVIEVIEDDPERVRVNGQFLPIMSQGEWMRGCPEGGEQSFLFSLYNLLSSESCACPQGCGYTVQRKKSDFFAIYPDFGSYIDAVRKTVQQKCTSCSAEFCLACGEPISRDKVHRPSAATDDNPLFHCSNLQGVILGVGLSMLEDAYTETNVAAAGASESNSGKSTPAKKKRKLEGTPEDDEEEYYGSGPKGKKAKGGIGYAGAVKEDMSGHLEALAAQKVKDQMIGGLLKEIRVYLPSLRRPGGGQTSDYLPHPTALAHLRRRFNHVSSALLRNDSLTDMSDRSVLYFELFEWLETVSNHESLASMMAMPCMVVSSVKPVKKPVRGKTSIRERVVTYEGSSGPRELLEAIVIQAQAAIKGLEGFKEPEKSPEDMTEEEKRMTADDRKGKAKEVDTHAEENAKLLKFCERILATATAIDRSLRQTKGDAFVERLHASLPRIPTSTTEEVTAAPIKNATDEEIKRAYVDWATRVRFEYCDLSIEGTSGEAVNYKTAYNGEARMLANADLPKRSLAIAKELAVLTTNLPVAWDSSVFLRVDETRVDVIKALITGPEGTPYYNGCYCFDIFLGSSYNQTPPSVKYMTTNGGKYRFNPNLYADGKVCLSLLGTWAGPGWIAGKSTLLQVLISIQSMILCEEPYLNEPGWAAQSGTPASQAYSANVRRMVVNTAMLGQLKNPPEPFGDLIRTHFRLKAKAITQQLDAWVKLDDGRATVGDGGGASPGPGGSGASAHFLKDVDELKKLIAAL